MGNPHLEEAKISKRVPGVKASLQASLQAALQDVTERPAGRVILLKDGEPLHCPHQEELKLRKPARCSFKEYTRPASKNRAGLV